jgi:hypothetical protein
MSMPLSVVDISYQAIPMKIVDVDQNLCHDIEYDQFTFPIWVTNPPN